MAASRRSSPDYSRFLVLYSGGADSTYFIQREPTAKHLIHYRGINDAQTKAAVVNATLLNRYLTIRSLEGGGSRDGELNEIHAFYDTQMAIDAAGIALAFGMQGIVMCFNKDDLGIEVDAVRAITARVDPKFTLLTPLRDTSAKEVRASLAVQKMPLKSVSCMYGTDCGFCGKCLRGY